jgi:hypothetical protein
MSTVLETDRRGAESGEHAAFAEQLQDRREGGTT